MGKKRIGGAAIVTAGLVLGRETVFWAWAAFLDLLTAGNGRLVTWESFPWLNAVGVLLTIVGLLLFFWDPLAVLFGKRQRQVAALAGEFDGFKMARQRENEGVRMHLAVVDRRLGEIEARLDPDAKEA